MLFGGFSFFRVQPGDIRPGGRSGVSYSNSYATKGRFDRLMGNLPGAPLQLASPERRA
jgi:hypothetical protein